MRRLLIAILALTAFASVFNISQAGAEPVQNGTQVITEGLPQGHSVRVVTTVDDGQEHHCRPGRGHPCRHTVVRDWNYSVWGVRIAHYQLGVKWTYNNYRIWDVDDWDHGNGSSGGTYCGSSPRGTAWVFADHSRMRVFGYGNFGLGTCNIIAVRLGATIVISKTGLAWIRGGNVITPESGVNWNAVAA